MAKKVRSNGSRPGKSARKRKSVAARRGRASAAPAPKSGHSLADLPTEVLARELARRRSELPKLERRAAELRKSLAALNKSLAAQQKALNEVEARMAELGVPASEGASSAVRAGRARGAGAARDAASASGARAPRRERKGAPTLGARLLAYLHAHPGIHPPGALAETIAAEMGRECSQSFIVSTNAALRKLIVDGGVEKVGRGQYRAKGSADAAAN
ncbi:MAG: hypothetical protein LW806_03925 [Planctomycetaceae bacterium]|nr:hypothetical protein [Planctomycetaceae bacterium]